MSRLFYLENCGSTNDEILRFLGSAHRDSTGVYTFNQTNGRGQYGNLWKTSKNENIALTVAVKESAVKTSDSLFNFHTALLVRDFLANLTKTEVKVKWPNDLILHNKKVCGLLTEKKKLDHGSYFLIGIGLNVLQKNYEAFPKAGSLLTQTGKTFDLHTVASSLHRYLSHHITSGITGEDTLKLYNEKLFKRNQVAVFSINKVRQNGIITKVDEDGFLWIELEVDGLQKFFHKEVQLLY